MNSKYTSDTHAMFTKTKYELIYELADNLHLNVIDIPIIGKKGTGCQDDLDGLTDPVSFKTKDLTEYEILQSAAKFKRNYLYKLEQKYESLEKGVMFTMHGVRPGEVVDSTHSVYLSQFDWEISINEDKRNLETLFLYANSVYNVLRDKKISIENRYSNLPSELFCISSQELLDLFPTLSDVERENEIVRKHKSVFVYEIGKKLSNGTTHSQRAPDYDDWDLCGDIIVEHFNKSLELSSMGIRVTHKVMEKQLKSAGLTDRLKLEWHKTLHKMPLTIGGGIGRERSIMYIYNIPSIHDTLPQIDI